MKAGKRPRVFKYGEQARDFVSVEDVVAGNVRTMMRKATGVSNVARGWPVHSIRFIAALNKTLQTTFWSGIILIIVFVYAGSHTSGYFAAREAFGYRKAILIFYRWRVGQVP